MKIEKIIINSAIQHDDYILSSHDRVSTIDVNATVLLTSAVFKISLQIPYDNCGDWDLYIRNLLSSIES
jgi:hypothetical protein